MEVWNKRMKLMRTAEVVVCQPSITLQLSTTIASFPKILCYAIRGFAAVIKDDSQVWVEGKKAAILIYLILRYTLKIFVVSALVGPGPQRLN